MRTARFSGLAGKFSCIAGRVAIATWLALGLGLAVRAEPQTAEPGRSVKQRSFRLDYGATLRELPDGAKVRVWLPVPQSNEFQEVKGLGVDVPGKAEGHVEPKYGNRILYFAADGPKSGELSFKISYKIRRSEVRGLDGMNGPLELGPVDRNRFLSPDARVPLGGRPLELVNVDRLPKEPLEVARVLYNTVDDHVKYDKSRPGYGNGDVLWVCDSQFGNCTDFHSLFISLARSLKIPAHFEIGFPLPPEHGAGTIAGYHCWAMFHVSGKGWVPVDISEADKHPELKEYYFGNLTEDRVTFSSGRDLELVPKQAGGPLNFFIYPYVEVDGQVWPKEKVTLNFAYADE